MQKVNKRSIKHGKKPLRETPTKQTPEENNTQNTWTNRNIDLQKLKQELTTFLTDNLFETQTLTMQNGYQIIAKESANYVFDGQVIITTQGEPNEFSIDLELEKKKSRFRMPIMLQTMLGGGIFIIQEQRQQEARLEFTKDFWDYTNRIITRLAGTANAPTDMDTEEKQNP